LRWGWRKFAGYCSYGVHSGYDITHGHHRQRPAKAWKAFPRLGINPRRFHGLKPFFCDVFPYDDGYALHKAVGATRRDRGD
jgi:hypothetical protein